MNKNLQITHEDLTMIGCYIIVPAQEKAYLERLNDEYAQRVGEAVANMMASEMMTDFDDIPEEEIWEYLEENAGVIIEITKIIREEFLEEVSERCRKTFMGGYNDDQD